jgi:hypothetical protein
MASSYSTNLALELIGTGDQAGTWGITTNTNLGTLLEQAISGYVTQAVSTGGDTTITIPNGADGVARNMYIELTGTGGADTNLIVPANKKLYFIFNNTASGQVTVKVSGQTGVSVPNKAKVVLVSDGTDIVDATNYVGNLSAASATITNLSSSSATITNLLATSSTITDTSTAAKFVPTGNVTAGNGMYLPTTNTLAFSTNGSERVSIGSTGNLLVNGSTGIGASNPFPAQYRLWVGSTLANANSYGIVSEPTASINSPSGSLSGFTSVLTTADSAITVGTARGVFVANAVKGAASTITNLHGVFVSDQTQGTNNFGVTSEVSSGTNKFNIYASGTAANYFAGNVGIGTPTPGGLLDIGGVIRVTVVSDYLSNSTSTLIGRTDGNGSGIFAEAGHLVLQPRSSTGRSIIFATGSTTASERLRITDTGNVGIGTASPQGRLDVSSGAAGVTAGDLVVDTANNVVYVGRLATANSTNFIVRNRLAAEGFKVDTSSGTITSTYPYNTTVGGTNRDVFVDSTGLIGYVSSVRESKTNITLVSDVSWLLQLNPVTFNFRKKDAEGKYTDEPDGPIKHGLIAEEVEAVNADLCFYDDVEVGGKLRGVNYSHLITPMLKLLQEQQAMIDELKAEVAALKGT